MKLQYKQNNTMYSDAREVQDKALARRLGARQGNSLKPCQQQGPQVETIKAARAPCTGPDNDKRIKYRQRLSSREGGAIVGDEWASD